MLLDKFSICDTLYLMYLIIGITLAWVKSVVIQMKSKHSYVFGERYYRVSLKVQKISLKLFYPVKQLL